MSFFFNPDIFMFFAKLWEENNLVELSGEFYLKADAFSTDFLALMTSSTIFSIVCCCVTCAVSVWGILFMQRLIGAGVRFLKAHYGKRKESDNL